MLWNGFVKTAAAAPELKVADVSYNVGRIIDMMEDACDMGVRLLVFPELCITGASCGDLFKQQRLLEAAGDGLQDIIDASAGMDMVVFVGLPYEKDGKLYNVTAVVKDGSLLGLVPKSGIRLLGDRAQERVFEDGQEIPELIDTGFFYALQEWENFPEETFAGEDGLLGIEEDDGGEEPGVLRMNTGTAGSGEEADPEDAPDGDCDEEDDWDEEEAEETIEAPFGTNLVFECAECEGLSFAVEMGEEGQLAASPASSHAAAGASIIINPCAAPALAGSFERIKERVTAASGRLICAYVRAGAASGESTTDLVFDGCRVIAENGALLGADSCIGGGEGILINDIDYEQIRTVRMNEPSFLGMDEQEAEEDYIFVSFSFFDDRESEHFDRRIDPNPFIPASGEKRMLKEILEIQALGLAKRLDHTGSKRIVLGLSGGLDSTLALLVSLRAAELIGFGPEYVLCLSMPAFGTSEQTRKNLQALAASTGIELREIDLKTSLLQHFQDIGHPVDVHDSAYENAQARERTQVLMDIANMEGGLVVGTGDLSEAALGWCTYNGDQMSMYAVNADVPKTVIRQMIGHIADTTENHELSAALKAVLDTPVSPELLPTDAAGAIDQKTEDIVGPYELHDFFLYYMLRFGYTPQRIAFLAEHAFAGRYDRRTILKWLGTMYRRFFGAQFKRSASVDGPKVFAVALSPRGELMMPSDAVSGLWLEEVEILQSIDELEGV